jgi:uncharacterized protein
MSGAVTAESNWAALWKLATDQFRLGEMSLHGPRHWRTVEVNALELAKSTGADVVIVRLFAVLHDSQRHNETHDPFHGQRAADWAATLRGSHFELDNVRFKLLETACVLHDKGKVSDDVTIGTCWDADRLDLIRVGAVPRADLSTAAGKPAAADESAIRCAQKKADPGKVGFEWG